MKIFLLLLLLVVRGPLLCEENSLLGYRLDWNNSKELFNFGRIVFETRAVVCALACILCVLHVIIACRKWREKQNCVFRGQLNNEPANSLRQLIHDCRENRDEKADENVSPLRVIQGFLIKLKGFKLEMLVWYILHDMLRIDVRPYRLFIFKLRPACTVDEIVAEEELKPLQEYVLDVSGNPEKIKPTREYNKNPNKTVTKRETSNVKKVSKLKEGVENMTEMITSMFAPCVTKTQFENDYESFLYPKIKKITKEREEQFCLPPGGHEEAMQKSFNDECEIYSSEMAENLKQTVKAYYMMAGGFASDSRRLSEEEQARKEEGKQFRVLQVEMETGNTPDDIVVSEGIETAPQSQELRFIKYEQNVLGLNCSLGELKAGNIAPRMEKKVNSRRTWIYKDYTVVACGMVAVVFISVGVYRFFRR